ncbi:MAG TPA: sensor histidine kinase [Sideroxyarcus sp.]|nr:sensor histidine kinase [Sideroxyarcus sp.]
MTEHVTHPLYDSVRYRLPVFSGPDHHLRKAGRRDAMNIETIGPLTQPGQLAGHFAGSKLPLAAHSRRRRGYFKEQRDDTASEQRIITELLLSTQEHERKRIAQDLHDGLGQSLTMIKLSLSESERLLASGAIEDAAVSLRQLQRKAQAALDEMRHAIMDLRPPMLDHLGILPTLSWFFRELEAVCHGVRVEKEFDLQEDSIPGKLKITIFRIVQEATSNIIKYAKADRMRVSLRQTGDALCFEIEDNGVGFRAEEVAVRNGSDRGLGLLGMKERANVSGGVYLMESAAGAGTKICISWQLGRLSGC